MTCPVETWTGCYDDGWRDIITDESFAHPAKISRRLLQRIYDDLLASGAIRKGDLVIDPFCGVCTGGLEAAPRGLRFIGVELEARFVAFGRANIARHARDWAAMGCPQPIVIQGDSRRLREVLRNASAQAIVSSPPYVAPPGHDTGHPRLDAIEDARRAAEGTARRNGYGEAAGQLSAMRPGEVSCLISSPPYADQPVNPGESSRPEAKIARLLAEGKHAEAESVRQNNSGASNNLRQEDYGTTDGQLGALPAGEVSAIISSPPYADSLQQGEARDPGKMVERERRYVAAHPELADKRPEQQLYGSSDGQLGAMKAESSVDALISSPPYAGNAKSDYLISDDGKTRARDERRGFTQGRGCFRGSEAAYGQGDGQLGAMDDGSVEAVISSPPYASGGQSNSARSIDAQQSNADAKKHYEDWKIGKQEWVRAYGTSEGQLGTMDDGSVEAVISSPPYEASAAGAGGLNTKPPRHEGDQSGRTPSAPSQDTDQRYGDADGQLAKLPVADALIASPPYADSINNSADKEASFARLQQAVAEGRCATHDADRRYLLRKTELNSGSQVGNEMTYGTTDGQLGAMKDSEGVLAIVSSPPYADRINNLSEKSCVKTDEQREQHHLGGGQLANPQNYGTTDGQLGAMKDGDVSAIVSSPPYADSVNAQGHGIDWTKVDPTTTGNRKRGEDTKHGQTLRAQLSYGTTDGQLGAMKDSDASAVVSSPPYEESLRATHNPGPAALRATENRTGQIPVYGLTDGNLGNDANETFWSAALAVVRECYALLRPGGCAVWIVKAFVRDRQVVDFPGDWRRLCEHVGFETVKEVHASLVEEWEEHTLFDGPIKKTREKKSFFRRLAEKKGSPKIDFEAVLFMVKPVTE